MKWGLVNLPAQKCLVTVLQPDSVYTINQECFWIQREGGSAKSYRESGWQDHSGSRLNNLNRVRVEFKTTHCNTLQKLLN